MSALWLIPIGIAIGFAVWFLQRRHAKKFEARHPLTYSVEIPPECYDNNQQTANGVTVRPYALVSPEALQLIENGIAHTIRNTANQNWSQFRNLSDFQVFLVPPMTHNVETDPGSPALMVKYLDAGGNIGQVQAAGTCIGVSGSILGLADPRYPSIILPFEASQLPAHASYLEESARNEAEHIVMWANNKNMYFNYTGANDQHPIFPDA